jgi:hypothetical protein
MDGWGGDLRPAGETTASGSVAVRSGGAGERVGAFDYREFSRHRSMVFKQAFDLLG